MLPKVTYKPRIAGRMIIIGIGYVLINAFSLPPICVSLIILVFDISCSWVCRTYSVCLFMCGNKTNAPCIYNSYFSGKKKNIKTTNFVLGKEEMTFEITAGGYMKRPMKWRHCVWNLIDLSSFWRCRGPSLFAIFTAIVAVSLSIFCPVTSALRWSQPRVVLYTPARDGYPTYRKLKHVLRKSVQSLVYVFCSICIFAVDSILKLILKYTCV